MSRSKRSFLSALDAGLVTSPLADALALSVSADELSVRFPNLPDLGTFHMPKGDVVAFVRKVGSDAVAFRQDDTLAVEYRALSDALDLYTEDGATIGASMQWTPRGVRGYVESSLSGRLSFEVAA